MRLFAAVLAVALAMPDGGTPPADPPLDAGTPFDAPLYRSCPTTEERAEPTDAGWWRVPDARAARLACLLATCEEFRKQNERTAPPEAFVIITTIATAAVSLAFGAGVLVGRASR